MNQRQYSDKFLFDNKREIAILRDDEKCTLCGMTRNEHRKLYGLDIVVHHIDGKGTTTLKAHRNNAIDNLQTLCVKCHARIENTCNKLTDIQVINIRHMRGSISNYKIAKLYGVSRQYVGQLMNNYWRCNV